MPSPADREAQAREDVERIARQVQQAAHETAPGYGFSAMTWSELEENDRDYCRAVVKRLLLSDVVRVGHRPVALDDIFPGQSSIDDELSDPSPD